MMLTARALGDGGMVLAVFDLTASRRLEAVRRDFVANVSHELKTPLTVILGFAETLAAGDVPQEEGSRFVEAIQSNARRMQQIVDDLLDLSRIQAGKVEVSVTPLSAKSLVDAALAARADSARDAKVELRARLDEPILPVLVDPDRIALVFDNLIGNALRHTAPAKGITVSATPGDGVVRFEVADEGSGIAPEYQQRIFEKFFRVPGTKGEGIGLGLYISREIVTAHGGEMGVSSEPGKGSRFWFTLRVPPRA
jgi:two-component system phosphate regulon sensor histidine kinase PhoR